MSCWLAMDWFDLLKIAGIVAGLLFGIGIWIAHKISEGGGAYSSYNPDDYGPSSMGSF
ncbi:MAG: hypothetical protein V1910_01610 [bacterium]